MSAVDLFGLKFLQRMIVLVDDGEVYSRLFSPRHECLQHLKLQRIAER